ncbi:O-fucosyltransferase family protein [Cyclobacterium xiamenense]|nr:hypothetical protein [Cyclobacterium xiamenense]
MPKRSTPDRERLTQLRREDSYYHITCFKDEFYCNDHPDGRCMRGFFSLFIQALNGMTFAIKYGLPYKVDFSNATYPYSNAGEEIPTNFWEELMVPQALSPDRSPVYNLRYETYPLRIWHRGFLRSLHQTLRSEIRFQKNLTEKIATLKEKFKPFRVLGLHARRTDHYLEVPSVDEEVFLLKIKKKIQEFDRLFVATDDAVFLEALKRLYPEKVLAHDFYRSNDKQAVHDHRSGKTGLLLGEQALLDCLSLSFCQELILSPSNLSYAALVFQPDLPYSLVESRAAAWSRRKTLLAYLLNRWGIRKW